MPKVTYLRVKPPVNILRDDDGNLVVPNPALAYASDDPLVVKYPWQFAKDDDMAEELQAIVEEVVLPKVEQPKGKRR